MTAFSLSGFFTCVSAVSLGLLVLLKSRDRKLARVWFCFSLAVTVWGICSWIIGFIDSAEQALLVWKISYAFGVLWVAPLFHHFVCVFSGKEAGWSSLNHYLIGLLFFLTIPTQLFISNVQFLFGLFYYASEGPTFPIFFFWWTGLVIYSHFKLVKIYRCSRSEKQNQIEYFFLATTIGYIGGILCALPIFGVHLYPWGNFGISLYPLIMSYAILRYRLMDINFFFKRAGLMLLVYAALLLVSVPVAFAFHKYAFNNTFAPSVMAIEVIGLGIIFSSGPFIYAYIVRQTSLFNEDTIASLTHELKSPLASIEGAFDYLVDSDKNDSLSPDEKESYQFIVKRNLSRLTQSIDEIIQVMQFQHSKGVFNKVDTADLVMMINNIVKKQETLFQAKKLLVILDCEPALFICDSSKIEQAISNILSNAIKFSNQGIIFITAKANAGELQISIKDQGHGIPPKEIGKIFDRFYQGRRNKNAKGTGIGLTIAKTWIEAHGGRIWAESEGEGKGTTVSFTLPNLS